MHRLIDEPELWERMSHAAAAKSREQLLTPAGALRWMRLMKQLMG
jgi:hypothetical protein